MSVIVETVVNFFVKAIDKCFTRAVALTGDALVKYNDGLAYWKEGKCLEAIYCFYEVIRLEPNCAEAYICLSAIHHKQGNYKEEDNCSYDALNILYLNARLGVLQCILAKVV